MPELPEVHTTVQGLSKVLPGLTVQDVWSDMFSRALLSRGTIKDKAYFPYFKKTILNAKVLRCERRAKYILLHLSNEHTIIIHMKMTGHLMYGEYVKNEQSNGKEWQWLPRKTRSPLWDPYNRHIHVVFSFSNSKQLAFCDSRKFGSISVHKTESVHTDYLKHLGPEPLDKSFTLLIFKNCLLKSSRAIKAVLMDQSIVAGIGNIYSDEMLFRARINPTRSGSSLTEKEWRDLFKGMKEVLRKGIDFGGDSTSDYRDIEGKRGAFHENHMVYLRTGEKCKRPRCKGIIRKKTIGGRSGHFCDSCQK
jgi:formamidopyrimidine-DNA glycosylase